MKILIIHSEGNTHNNPNLSGICQILSENGYDIDVLIPKLKQSLTEGNSLSHIRFIEYGKVRNKLLHISINKISSLILTKILIYILFVRFRQKKYDLIVGVDRNGLVISSILAVLNKVKVGMISYELLFSNENKSKFKEIEIDCSKNLLFAICQDELRSSLLSRENNIPLKKIFNIPVAGRYQSKTKSFRPSTYLHDKLGIDKSKKIAFYGGSLDYWTMIPELIDNLSFFPPDWVVVLHGRYGSTKEQVSRLCHHFYSPNLFFSEESVSTNDEMHIILNSIDLGLAFYKPTSGPATGLNLKYLGLSSGKISTYLQHGVPILCNEIGQMSDYIRKYNLGFVIKQFNEIPGVLNDYDKYSYYDRCISFFKDKLDLNTAIIPFLDFLKQSITTN
jgi:hypothetical protein